jgi:hypothetical protein
MDLIESSLWRLRKRVSRFVAPSAALRNVGYLRLKSSFGGLLRHSSYSPHVAATHAIQKERRRLQDSLFGSIAVPDVYGGQLECIINYQEDPAPGLKLSFDLLAT